MDTETVVSPSLLKGIDPDKHGVSVNPTDYWSQQDLQTMKWIRY